MKVSLLGERFIYVGGGAGVTQKPLDTRSASALVAFAFDYSGFPATTAGDTIGNSWTSLTAILSSSAIRSRLFYVASPRVGRGQRFIQGGGSVATGLFGAAFAGVARTSPFGTQNGNAGNGTSGNTLSITPAAVGDLVVCGIGLQNPAGADSGTITIDSGFTILDQCPASAGGGTFGGAFAYWIATSTSAINPTFSWTGSREWATAIATFSASARQLPKKQTRRRRLFALAR